MEITKEQNNKTVSLADELKARQMVKVIKFAEEYAEKMKPIIIASAEKGYSGYRNHISERDENFHIKINDMFIEKVNELMDGVEVKIDKEKRTTILNTFYTEYHIHFKW